MKRAQIAMRSFGICLLGLVLVGLGGCAGGVYETGYSSGYYYGPDYSPYFGAYGYTGTPFLGYGGYYRGPDLIVRGVKHRRYYGHHHFTGERHGRDRGRHHRRDRQNRPHRRHNDNH